MTGKELYNSRIIFAFIKLIQKKYAHVDIGMLLDQAGMERHQVQDQGHWFTQEQVDRFYERAREMTGNDRLAQEAGRYAISLDAIGAVRQYIQGLVDPVDAYLLVQKLIPKFTKSSHYGIVALGPNKVQLTVTPYPGVEERPYQCENRIGYFEGVGLSQAHQLPTIVHTECVFKGGKSCRYEISWKDTPITRWKKLRKYGIGAALAFCLGLLAMAPFAVFLATLGFAIVGTLAADVYIGMLERQHFHQTVSQLRSASEELMERIEAQYNNAVLINEVGVAVSKRLEIRSVIKNVVEILRNRLDFDRGMILLANADASSLDFCAGFGYTTDELALLKNAHFHLDRPTSKGPFVVSFREQRTILVDDIEQIASEISARSYEFAKSLGTKAFICCPIVFEKESLGILAVDNIKSKRPLLQSDINLLMGIAPEIGISLHNARLIEARQEQFKSTLEVLAKSIDARDFLTAGHSVKVTEHAVGIGRELGMSDEYCEMIRVASLLHDYGKIGISDAILKKPGRLTDEEFEQIKTHAEKTREILLGINFQGIYREVPDIAGAHHEKVDGSGYPRGLRGDAIPLGARIIAVADFFEAVTAQRHYRDPIPVDIALQMLEAKRDRHYDGVVIDAFLRYYAKGAVVGGSQLAGLVAVQQMSGV